MATKSKKVTKTTVTRNTAASNDNYLDRIETEIKSNQSTLSLVLGILIVLVLGVLLFNYFNRDRSQNVGPAQQVTQTEQEGDVSPENLPGKYTVKDGDTLFTIAENYYKDGFKYSEIVKANNLTDENAITTGQVLEIPKLEDTAVAESSPSPETTTVAEASPTPTATEQAAATPAPTETGDTGTGGANTTIWGPTIEGTTYTVAEGDWLSTIAARAYGDIMSYQKIAQANNITNPDVITPGMAINIPR